MQTTLRDVGNITWNAEQVMAFELALAQRPHLRGLSHVSICANDLQVSKQFYSYVLGGRITGESEHFAIVTVANTVIGISDLGKAPLGHTADAEYPHIAFEVDSDQFIPMKKWLESHGVPTHEPWTRYQIEALMYFKEPAGNLLEMYCPQYANAKDARNTRNVQEVVKFENLNYTWDPSVASPVLATGIPARAV